jgi:competence protein ComEA
MLRSLFAAALALAIALPAFAATPININKADAATIASSLDGVGEAKAKAIVAWREAHGPFKTLDDLAQVKGMGPATLKRNSDAIQFSGNAAGAAAKAPKAAKAKAKSKAKAKASAK